MEGVRGCLPVLYGQGQEGQDAAEAELSKGCKGKWKGCCRCVCQKKKLKQSPILETFKSSLQGLWATWSSWRYPWPRQGGRILKRSFLTQIIYVSMRLSLWFFIMAELLSEAERALIFCTVIFCPVDIHGNKLLRSRLEKGWGLTAQPPVWLGRYISTGQGGIVQLPEYSTGNQFPLMVQSFCKISSLETGHRAKDFDSESSSWLQHSGLKPCCFSAALWLYHIALVEQNRL